MRLGLNGQIGKNIKKAAGGGNGRNANVRLSVAKATKKIIYAVCGRKGGLP